MAVNSINTPAHGDASHEAATTTLANGAAYQRFASDTYKGGNDVASLKGWISYSEVLRKDGRNVVRSGKHLSCACPFHNDSTPSFTIYDDCSAYCFGCSWSGDVFAYIQKRDDCDFKTAKALLEQYLRTGVLTPQARSRVLPSKAEATAEPYVRSKGEELQARMMTRTLYESPRLLERVSGSRGWKAQTIERLAREGSLGWHQQSIAFIYDTGVKVRPWPWKRDGIRWLFGKPSIWREQSLPGASEVYVTEGETDCISLIDSRICNGTTTVVAAPSATTFKAEWAALFAGNTVTLCLDDDQAGQKGTDRLIPLLTPYAKEIYTLSWKEVGYAS
jgi:hypothetical protein